MSLPAPQIPLLLCIDDQKSNLAVRKLFLETQGYSVLTASSGPEGLQLLRGTPVDALVLDYRMPGMNGDEVASVVKRECPQLPIIVLSGHPADIPDSLRDMASAFVAKGSPPEILLDALKNALGFQPQRQPPQCIDQIREHTDRVQEHVSRAREHLEHSKKTASRIAQRNRRIKGAS